MNTVWVYGCSFSEPFQLESGGPEWNQLGDRVLRADYWGTHLADKLSMNLVTRSLSGVGLNYILNQVSETWQRWHPDDIVIISPSFFSRVTVMEFLNPEITEHTAHFYLEWAQLAAYNQRRWCSQIQLFKQIVPRVYTWCVEDAGSVADSLAHLPIIPAPDRSINWKHWMDRNPQYWQSLPGVVYPQGDWHFNSQCHLAVAAQFYNHICQAQP